MVAAVDIGNSRIHLGLFNNGRLVRIFQLPVRAERGYPRIEKWLVGQKIEGAGIASVIPDNTRSVAAIFRRQFRIRPLIIDSRIDSGLKFGYQNPRTLGADRIANLAGGRAHFPGNLIVVSFGTATTIDAVFRNGYHPGGVIMPGIDMDLDVLAQQTARIGRYPVRRPVHFIGRNTGECVRSGVIQGMALAVQGFIHEIKKVYRRPFLGLATGGRAGLMAPLIPEIDRVVADLSLYGIFAIYQRNA
jgi:type III pantothenate kinase